MRDIDKLVGMIGERTDLTDEEIESILDECGFIPPVALAYGVYSVVDEEISCNVILVSHGLSKIQVIKYIKAKLSLSLFESVEMVNSSPCVILRKVLESEALLMKSELEELGATIEIRIL